MTTTIEPGSWVLCWGQVQDESARHPDDTAVRLESHNEDYICFVRTDRLTFPGALPDFALKCNALIPFRQPGTFARCIRHHGHGGDHQIVGSGARYADHEVRGYIEEV